MVDSLKWEKVQRTKSGREKDAFIETGGEKEKWGVTLRYEPKAGAK